MADCRKACAVRVHSHVSRRDPALRDVRLSTCPRAVHRPLNQLLLQLFKGFSGALFTSDVRMSTPLHRPACADVCRHARLCASALSTVYVFRWTGGQIEGQQSKLARGAQINDDVFQSLPVPTPRSRSAWPSRPGRSAARSHHWPCWQGEGRVRSLQGSRPGPAGSPFFSARRLWGRGG